MEEEMYLPPGFRFHPTDEELITHYLTKKVRDSSFLCIAIGEVDLNKCEPWDMPKRSRMAGKELYFFCVKDKKYPTGLRTNRATEAGYWKATGKDKEIFRGKMLVGMKKTLVFYTGRAPRGDKSGWVMHEYRLEGTYSAFKTSKNEWVICRVFNKNFVGEKVDTVSASSSSYLPPLDTNKPKNVKSSPCSSLQSSAHVTCFSNQTEEGRHGDGLLSTIAAADNGYNCFSSAAALFSATPLTTFDSSAAAEFAADYPGGSLLQLLHSSGYGTKQDDLLWSC